MDVGMLWFDNDPHTSLPVKVTRAADYYRKKYGVIPDLCQVHPSMLTALSPDLLEERVDPPEKAATPGQSRVPVIPASNLRYAAEQVSRVRLSEGRQPGLPSPGSGEQVRQAALVAGMVVIRPSRLIQPGYLWIGRESEN